MTGVAFVSGSARAEGLVRGPGIYAVSCSLAMRVLGAGSGTPQSDENTTTRAFADREDRARTECLAHAAATLVGKVAPSQTPASADARTVIVDADIVEAAAVPALLRTFRRMGTVAAADVRRVVPGHAEIRVRTRAGADALLAGIGRDRDPGLQLDSASVGGDTLRVRVRLRENRTVPPAGEGTTPATTPGAALPRPVAGDVTAFATAKGRPAIRGED